MNEHKTTSYTGQCPFLMTRRAIEIKFERHGDFAVPIKNFCDYDEDCRYYDGCPVMESCKREQHLW